MRERPISDVPVGVLIALALAFSLQLFWHSQQAPLTQAALSLDAPPSAASMRISSLGEPIATGKMLMLYVQAADAQPGLVSFKTLSYVHLSAWLSRVLELDPRGNYPLFLAGQVYGAVHDEAKKRAMFEFIYQQFLLDPNRRWRALADAAVVARHTLKDIPLAKKYTLALRLHATGPNVPIWVKQMDIFLMEDLGEVKSARLLLGALFSSGQITDPRETAFVLNRLKQMEAKENPTP